MERKVIGKFIFTLILMICLFQAASTQDKIEKEYKIDQKSVPQSAVKWVIDAFPDARMDWYYEETSGVKSYEAKLKWDDHKFSIEFDTLGVLEDVEMDIDWEEISDNGRKGIAAFLQKEDDNYKIRKIQKQLSGDADLVIQYIKGDVSAEVIRRYEIEYYSTSNDKFNLWEGLFSDDGKFIKKRRVQLLTTDNLDF
jgi:hypothetical protein